MKTVGWVIIVLGVLSFIGCLTGGNSISGPLFLIGLGAYLVHRGRQKEREEQEKDEWEKK